MRLREFNDYRDQTIFDFLVNVFGDNLGSKVCQLILKMEHKDIDEILKHIEGRKNDVYEV